MLLGDKEKMMRRKTILIALVFFVLGGIIFASAATYYLTKVFAGNLLLVKDIQLAESAQGAWAAYFDEPPPVASWAIKRHLMLVQNLLKMGYQDEATLCLHELAAHVRLAELAGRNGNHEEQASQMAQALASAQRSPADIEKGLTTEKQIRDFVELLNKKRLP